MKEMVEQQQLTVIISYLMEQLGVDKMRISQKDLKRIRNNDTYCGIKAENDKNDGKQLVENACKTRYNNNVFLNKFKYKINSGANTTSINMQDNKLNIISLYTSDIFIDSDFLKILDKSIDEDLQNISS